MTSAGPAPAGPELALRPRSGGRRWVRWTAYAGALVVLVAVVAWVSTHPAQLPTSNRTVAATTPVGEPVYVGVFEATGDRTLHVSGVRIFADVTMETTIVPHVCQGGSVSVTTNPASFCRAVVPTEGAVLEAGDEIVLEISAEAAGAIDIDRIRVAYRDGVQWAVQDAGSPSRVEVIAR